MEPITDSIEELLEYGASRVDVDATEEYVEPCVDPNLRERYDEGRYR